MKPRYRFTIYFKDESIEVTKPAKYKNIKKARKEAKRIKETIADVVCVDIELEIVHWQICSQPRTVARTYPAPRRFIAGRYGSDEDDC